MKVSLTQNILDKNLFSFNKVIEHILRKYFQIKYNKTHLNFKLATKILISSNQFRYLSLKNQLLNHKFTDRNNYVIQFYLIISILNSK